MAKPGTKSFDWELLETCCKIGLKLMDVAEIMKTSDDTIARRIRAKYDLTFAEYAELKAAHTRKLLRVLLLEKARGGNMAAIFGALKIWDKEARQAFSEAHTRLPFDAAPMKRLVIEMNDGPDEPTE